MSGPHPTDDQPVDSPLFGASTPFGVRLSQVARGLTSALNAGAPELDMVSIGEELVVLHPTGDLAGYVAWSDHLSDPMHFATAYGANVTSLHCFGRRRGLPVEVVGRMVGTPEGIDPANPVTQRVAVEVLRATAKELAA
jgi:hypothetical protein